MIHAQKLCLSFGDRDIFTDLSFIINDSDRIGLVGKNGSGKSTLLKILAHQQSLSSGKVVIESGKKIAYLSQDVVLSSQKNILEETLAALGEIDPEELGRVEAEARRVLHGLGFTHAQLASTVNTLSVGWKMRIILAQLLLQKADFYLFDEPTNHLDIVAKDWFLHFLKRAPFGFLLVCHERYFLDQLCTKILALEYGEGRIYNGNYSAYKTIVADEYLRLEAAYTQQQKEIERKKETIARFRASAARSAMAQSMMRELERMEIIKLPQQTKDIKITLPAGEPSGRHVLKVNHLAHTYGDRPVFQNISFEIERGEKVALIAANGVGKTTLVQIISGITAQQETGTITFGHNVRLALFQQDQNSILDHRKKIIEEVEDAAPEQTAATIRAALGSFLFSHDDVYKKIGVLSGGEKSRVGMVKALLQKANFLILDEPTNHLDMESKEVLLAALKNYAGTLLFVSHDHDFINQLATRILELTPTEIYSFSGNYEDYLYHKQHLEPKNSQDSQNTPQKPVTIKPIAAPTLHSQKEIMEHRKKVRRLEEMIQRLDKEKALLTAQLEAVKFDSPEFKTAYARLIDIEKLCSQHFNDWIALQEHFPTQN